MPHGLTILTATMTGGVVGAPAAANTVGCCCPCCPAWCAAYCPAWCTTAAPAAVPVVAAPHAAGVAAVPGAYAPTLPVSPPAGLPGGWGSTGGPIPPIVYPTPQAGAGYYGGTTPALTGAMTLFTTGRDRAGQLLKKLRDSAVAWGSDGSSASEHARVEAVEEKKEISEETKEASVCRRGSSSTTTASSNDRQGILPRWIGRTVRRSDAGGRCTSEQDNTDMVVFCGVAVEDEETGQSSRAAVFL